MKTVFDVLIEEIEERRDALTQALISGAAKDYAEYKHICGEIRGLTFAHAQSTDLARRIENDDD